VFLQAACQASLGGTIYLGSMALWYGEYNGITIEVFLSAKTLIGCLQVYQVMHCLNHSQTKH